MRIDWWSGPDSPALIQIKLTTIRIGWDGFDYSSFNEHSKVLRLAIISLLIAIHCILKQRNEP